MVLPPISRPLSDVMLDIFDGEAQYIFAAIEPMENFHQWFTTQYDTVLHMEFHSMMLDAILIFRAVEAMLRTKQRLVALLPAPAPVRNLPAAAPASSAPVVDAAPAPTASSAMPATGETDEMSITNAAGEVLSWY